MSGSNRGGGREYPDVRPLSSARFYRDVGIAEVTDDSTLALPCCSRIAGHSKVTFNWC
jgi:hypothetical protein